MSRATLAITRRGLAALARRIAPRVCPICLRPAVRFARTPDVVRDRGVCRGCGSYQRHRLLWLYLTRETDLLSARGLSVLHFAPEPGIARRLRAAVAEYVTADLEPGVADLTLDITDIDLADETFDVVLCLHVLEHVGDDRSAMRELHRVTKPGGWGVIQVPIWGAVTIEDPTATTPEARLRAFGQADHVRVYGRDFEQRLTQAGFDVDVVAYRDRLSATDRRRHGLYYDLEPDLGFDLNQTPEAWEIWRVSRN